MVEVAVVVLPLVVVAFLVAASLSSCGDSAVSPCDTLSPLKFSAALQLCPLLVPLYRTLVVVLVVHLRLSSCKLAGIGGGSGHSTSAMYVTANLC